MSIPFERSIEQRLSFLKQRKPEYQKVIDKVFPLQVYKGKIDMSVSNVEPGVVWDMLINSEQYGFSLQTTERLYQSGLLTSMYGNRGAKNSRKILKMFEELGFAKTDPRVNMFMRDWVNVFPRLSFYYRLGTTIRYFRRLGELPCDTTRGEVPGSCFGRGKIHADHASILYWGRPSFVIWISSQEGLLDSNIDKAMGYVNGRAWGFVHPQYTEQFYVTNWNYFRGMRQAFFYFPPVLEKITGLKLKEVNYNHRGFCIGVFNNSNCFGLCPKQEKSVSHAEHISCERCGAINGSWLCRNCNVAGSPSDPYVIGTCVCCDQDIYEGEELYELGEDVVCGSCFEEYYTTCNGCHCVRDIQEMVTVSNNRGEYFVCSDCVPHLTYECYSCGELRDNAERFRIPSREGDLFFCYACYDQALTDAEDRAVAFPNMGGVE